MSTIAAALLSLCCFLPLSALAQDNDHARHKNVGVGFHETTAPLGVRWWFGEQKIGVDLGLGFGSDPSFTYPDEKLTHYAISAGVPIVLTSWDRVHVLFRPGILYESQQVEATVFPAPFDTENEKTMTISGVIEAEAFLLENFSVSASTGVAYESFDPGFGLDKENSFRTVGGNFTNVGFHVYFLK
ncbi:MAG TPA: hypothetical protein VFD83_03360 [Candidatus Polarisedimenticolia bacterium]|nr:hypothetical protein [Candidatus Polarisedimenticolia bacterium]